MISIIPLRLQQFKKLLGLGLIDLRILFSKIPVFSQFQKLEPRLIPSMIFNVNKQFLKKFCLILKRGMFSAFLVTMKTFFSGIIQILYRLLDKQVDVKTFFSGFTQILYRLLYRQVIIHILWILAIMIQYGHCSFCCCLVIYQVRFKNMTIYTLQSINV